MKICLVNAVCGRALDTPRKLLDKYWHIPRLAEALAAQGLQVSILQAFHEAGRLEERGVGLALLAADRPLRAGGSDMVELDDFAELTACLQAHDPDVVHYFGLTVPRPLARIVHWARRHSRAVTASFHGGSPPGNVFARRLRRRLFRGIAGLMFTAQSYASAWVEAGVVAPGTLLTIAPEVSSPFAGLEQGEARKRLGIEGEPVFAWSGRLHPVKDPLTALRAFTAVCDDAPRARLLMAFQSDELLPDIEAYLDTRLAVKDRTTLLGALPHAQMELVFSAADFFIQTSRQEFGSNSLVEAMSCGAIPLLTDIPTFRTLTRAIEPAQLFACGDASGMAEGAARAMRADLRAMSASVQAGFRSHLAYPVLAQQYLRAFEAASALCAPGHR